MTRYTVIWLEAALEELATLWMNTVDRDGVTTAAHVVDQELAEDPDRKGVEKDPGIRRLTVSQSWLESNLFSGSYCGLIQSVAESPHYFHNMNLARRFENNLEEYLSLDLLAARLLGVDGSRF